MSHTQIESTTWRMPALRGRVNIDFHKCGGISLYFNTLILMLGRFASGLFAHASKAAQARAAVTVPTIGIASALLYSSVQPVCLQPSYTRPSFEERMKPKAQPVVLTKIEKNSGNEESSETESTEEEESAFDERTGEINWDCPCLGGMADGPCGEEFKQAFSCFVFSEAEPKGIDCIDQFKHMQDCFRRHPEVYAEEIEADEAAAAEVATSDSSTETTPSTAEHASPASQP